MVKGYKVSVDVKTGEVTKSEIEVTRNPPPPPPEPPIDMRKLKAVLLAKGIIDDVCEIEYTRE